MTRQEKLKMNRARQSAPQVLESHYFFSRLRGALREVGLSAAEENVGIGAYFVGISGCLKYPLRLSVGENTRDGAREVVRKVSRLLEPGNFVEMSPDDSQVWRCFRKNPHGKVLSVQELNQWESFGVRRARLDLARNELTRIAPVDRHGRKVEEDQKVVAPFAVLSTGERPDLSSDSRWFNTYLYRPPQPTERVPRPSSNGRHSLGSKEFADWHVAHQYIRERAKLPIELPGWRDLVTEEMREDPRRREHVLALLQAWKTMCVIRSFLPYERRDGPVLKASFTDFAATALLIRRLFSEGRWIPSIRGIFNEITKAGESDALIHPITGKGVRYIHREDPVTWGKISDYLHV